MKRKGFSLAEMLTVIVIVAILLSIVIPVFRSSRASANKVVCISNLKQIYTALKLYQVDNDNCYPPNSVTWPGLVTYLKVSFHCPSSRNSSGEYDYLLNCSPFGKEGDRRFKIWTACQSSRGGEFPLIFDYNHLSRLSSGRSSNLFVILTRENGSVISRPFNSSVPMTPCDTSVMGPYINY